MTKIERSKLAVHEKEKGNEVRLRERNGNRGTHSKPGPLEPGNPLNPRTPWNQGTHSKPGPLEPGNPLNPRTPWNQGTHSKPGPLEPGNPCKTRPPGTREPMQNQAPWNQGTHSIPGPPGTRELSNYREPRN